MQIGGVMRVTSQGQHTLFPLREAQGVVVGAEGEGIGRRVLSACDERVRLPMRGQVASLNVSVAVGVVAYEVLRQRGK